MRLQDRVAIVVGAGQGPGEGVGNGRATSIVFAREGARVLAVDLNAASAEATAAMAREAGGVCEAFVADVTKEATLAAAVAAGGNSLYIHNGRECERIEPTDVLTETA